MTYPNVQLLINNEWRPARGDATLNVHNPTDGKVIGTVARASIADLDEAGESVRLRDSVVVEEPYICWVASLGMGHAFVAATGKAIVLIQFDKFYFGKFFFELIALGGLSAVVYHQEVSIRISVLTQCCKAFAGFGYAPPIKNYDGDGGRIGLA